MIRVLIHKVWAFVVVEFYIFHSIHQRCIYSISNINLVRELASLNFRHPFESHTSWMSEMHAISRQKL